jgi:hypothetical protein
MEGNHKNVELQKSRFEKTLMRKAEWAKERLAKEEQEPQSVPG